MNITVPYNKTVSLETIAKDIVKSNPGVCVMINISDSPDADGLDSTIKIIRHEDFVKNKNEDNENNDDDSEDNNSEDNDSEDEDDYDDYNENDKVIYKIFKNLKTKMENAEKVGMDFFGKEVNIEFYGDNPTRQMWKMYGIDPDMFRVLLDDFGEKIDFGEDN